MVLKICKYLCLIGDYNVLVGNLSDFEFISNFIVYVFKWR